jgi:DNA-binding response OmpR family regulator
MKKKITVIDDDIKLLNLLSEYLEKNGFICSLFENPIEGIKYLKNNITDLIILDVMLPEIDGFEVCKRIRQTQETPIIILTARGDVMDKIIGLELGADDYLAKPFEPRELLARINSIFRRVERNVVKEEVLEFEDIEIQINSRNAIMSGVNLELTSTEFELLTLFAKNYGKVLSRDYIMQNTKGISWQSFDRSVDVMVSRLRNKLDADNKESYIKTVHSVGYLFTAKIKKNQEDEK